MILYNQILPNGLRIVHLSTQSPVAYCGFAINAGSRDELPHESGLAHFVEHALFKGTQKRRACHILNRMESVGGELNAYTTKESTFLYSIFREEDIERAVELTSDLIVNSQFPEQELDREREVVMDEIQSYEDAPAELIFDDFENLLFDGHSLGRHILGNKRSLRLFDAAACHSFVQRFYTAENMVFFSFSQVDFNRIVRLAKKYMMRIPSRPSKMERAKPSVIIPAGVQRRKKTHLSHAVTGGVACDMYDAKRYPLFLLNNLLGGPGMNSRLNVSLREKNGYAYTVESSISSYTDTGVFCIYFGSDPKNREQAARLVEKELLKLCANKLTDMQLAAAKKQAIGQLWVAVDNKESLFLGLGKSFLHYNRYETLQKMTRRIEDITAAQMLETANEFLHPDRLFSLLYE